MGDQSSSDGGWSSVVVLIGSGVPIQRGSGVMVLLCVAIQLLLSQAHSKFKIVSVCIPR